MNETIKNLTNDILQMASIQFNNNISLITSTILNVTTATITAATTIITNNTPTTIIPTIESTLASAATTTENSSIINFPFESSIAATATAAIAAVTTNGISKMYDSIKNESINILQNGSGGGSVGSISNVGSGGGSGIGIIDTTQYDIRSSIQHEHYDEFKYPREFCKDIDSDNVTYFNVSCLSPVEYSILLNGYITPFLLPITVTANTLIVIVLNKRNMATPTNFVLMCMAWCDMLTVLFPAPGFFYMYSLGNHYKPITSPVACYAFNTFNETMPNLFHTASIWLTVALAAHRYIYVCHAPMARTWCTMPRVKRCTLYIFIAAVLHQSTRFFDTTYSAVKINWNNTTVLTCKTDGAEWVIAVGEDYYYWFYYTFRVFGVHLLPCIILVTLNILLFRAMKLAQEKREKLLKENRKKECKKLRDANCTTLMLIVVVTVFLTVEIPNAVLTVLHIISVSFFDFLNYEVANLCVLFINFILIISYPINFAIYCGMSRQFRETFKEIFMKNGIKASKDSSSKYSLVNGPRTCTNETVL
ncbi:sex peptide receptor [Condylostylus longicornis]|uniref:sex peptide receptor n=1 Tax=Condylostylus longicornis TaxID=2530218 RepID=UPI00244DB1E8|nr:sex peptide receptor [Condylostylus longicornis]